MQDSRTAFPFKGGELAAKRRLNDYLSEFELLWREFFQWVALEHGKNCFGHKASGRNEKTGATRLLTLNRN